MCVYVREREEKGNGGGGKVMEMGEKRKKITRIHPAPRCGEFIRLRERKCQFFPGPVQMDLPPPPLLSSPPAMLAIL